MKKRTNPVLSLNQGDSRCGPTASRVVIPSNKEAKSGNAKAKIVECPENIVELRRLIQTWSRLESEKKRSVRKLEAERHTMKVKYCNLLRGKSTLSQMEESFILQPGFRYRANGEIRKVNSSHDPILRLYQNSRVEESKPKSSTESPCDSGGSSKIQVSGNTVTQNRKKNKIANTFKEVSKDIKDTEKALSQIRNSAELREINRKISNVKSTLTYLRAHTNDLPEKQRRYHGYGSYADQSSDKSNTVHKRWKSNCAACEHKLKSECEYVTNALNSVRSPGPAKRWQTAPRGCYVPTNIIKSDERKLSRPKVSKSVQTSRFGSTNGNKLKQVDYTQSLTMHGVNKQTAQQDLRAKLLSKTVTSLALHSPSKQIRRSSLDYHADSRVPDKYGYMGESKTTEENYRMIMVRGSLTSKHNQAILDDMCKPWDEEAALITTVSAANSNRLNIPRKKQPRRQSIPTHSTQNMLKAVDTLKDMVRLQSKDSDSKIKEFIKSIPAPDVAIKRWRSSTGANMKHESLQNLHESEDLNRASLDSLHSTHQQEPYVSAFWCKGEKQPPECSTTPQFNATKSASFDSGVSDAESESYEKETVHFGDIAHCRYLRLPSNTSANIGVDCYALK